MYVSKVYRASAEAERLALFECKKCGTRARVVARGRGEGSGEAPFFIGQEGAAQAAAHRARQGAWADAAKLVKLARCPTCSARPTASMTWLIVVQLLHLLWIGPLVFCPLWAGLIGSQRVEMKLTLPIAFFGALALSAGIAVLRIRRRLRRVDGGVAFVEVRA